MKEYTIRQNKVSRLVQRELSNILQQECVKTFPGSLITVTMVRVSSDLALAKIYLSIFSNKNKKEVFEAVVNSVKQIRHILAQNTRHQLRKTPELAFFMDDSLDYFDNINNILKNN